MKKKIAYNEKTTEELNKALSEKREELRTLRFTAAGARTKDASARAKARKEIARMLTAMTAKTKA